MPLTPVLHTPRLCLRETRVEDFSACARLWADPAVVRHIGGRVSSATDAWARMLRFPGLWALLGYGYWTVEDRANGNFVGQVGLADFKRPLLPSIDGIPEAGWVIASMYHGRGYATEAMSAALAWADRELVAAKSCCLIDPDNAPSIRVAEKLAYGAPVEGSLAGKRTLVFYRSRATTEKTTIEQRGSGDGPAQWPA